MNMEDRVEMYNELTLFDKQWFFDIILSRDVVIFNPVAEGGAETQDGSDYDTCLNGTQIQFNTQPTKEVR